MHSYACLLFDFQWIYPLDTFCMSFFFSDFAAGLDVNYCRNPDNTAMPWCYTDANGCERDYCDVCNIGRERDYCAICMIIIMIIMIIIMDRSDTALFFS